MVEWRDRPGTVVVSDGSAHAYWRDSRGGEDVTGCSVGR